MIKNGLAVACVALAAACQRSQTDHPGAYQGLIELDETVLAFEASGRVQRLLVDEGDAVASGALIAELDDDVVRATRTTRLLEAEAARSEAKRVAAGPRAEEIAALAARVRAAQAGEDLLAKDLARAESLVAKNAVPQSNADELSGQLERARAERQALESDLAALRRGARVEDRNTAAARAQAAESALDVEDDRLARYQLRSPLDGRVLDRAIEPGEVVAAGTPVVVVADTRRPYADVFVPQAELSGIDAGARARVWVDAERTPLSGRVEHVARRTEFTPRYLFSERERSHLVVRVRVRVDDLNERLHAGVPAFVEITRSGQGR